MNWLTERIAAPLRYQKENQSHRTDRSFRHLNDSRRCPSDPQFRTYWRRLMPSVLLGRCEELAGSAAKILQLSTHPARSLLPQLCFLCLMPCPSSPSAFSVRKRSYRTQPSPEFLTALLSNSFVGRGADPQPKRSFQEIFRLSAFNRQIACAFQITSFGLITKHKCPNSRYLRNVS